MQFLYRCVASSYLCYIMIYFESPFEHSRKEVLCSITFFVLLYSIFVNVVYT
jgi:hypothetical protein